MHVVRISDLTPKLPNPFVRFDRIELFGILRRCEQSLVFRFVEPAIFECLIDIAEGSGAILLVYDRSYLADKPNQRFAVSGLLTHGATLLIGQIELIASRSKLLLQE